MDLGVRSDERGSSPDGIDGELNQWEFQDPKMEILYHIRPYFVGIFSYIGLQNRPYIWDWYLQFRFLNWPLIK